MSGDHAKKEMETCEKLLQQREGEEEKPREHFIGRIPHQEEGEEEKLLQQREGEEIFLSPQREERKIFFPQAASE
jgi:hypothetical protein